MLELENIFLYKKNFSLKNISLNINEKNYHIILGPTGAGKTLLLESIVGINKIKRGKIYYKGERIDKKQINKRDIGIVYQNLYLFNHLNVKKNILYSIKCKNEKKNVEDKFNKIVSLLKIENIINRSVVNLSGGEKQRVALARTLMKDSDLILLDEPFSALDSITKWEIIRDVKKIFEKLGKTVIQVTHDIEEALFLADTISVIKNGKIIQNGRLNDVYNFPKNEEVAKLIKKDNLFKMKWNPRKHHFEKNGFEIYFDENYDYDTALVYIPPSSIVLSNEEVKTSARNVYNGKIRKIILQNYGAKILVDVGVALSVYLTKKSLKELNLKKGKKICLFFKTNTVELVDKE